MKRSFTFYAGGALAFLAGILALVTSLSQAQSKNGGLSATYLRGALHVSIPYNAPRGGTGNLRVEVLDPEDHVIGRVDRIVPIAAGSGFPEQSLALPASLTIDDLVWHRLRYQFTFQGDRTPALDGLAAVSQILRRPLIHVLGQQTYLTGSEAAIRLVVTEQNSQAPVTSGSVRIELQAAGKKATALYAGAVNPRGTTRAQFRFPSGLTGEYALHYVIDTPLGPAEQTQKIRIEEKSSILLTTEKPVYQPGQTIHVRALALDRATHQATANRKLTFEAEDSRGNKLFRAATQTDAYGVASTEFALADEVNLGTWHLRALVDEDNKAETALQVERYVLPRFKVAVDLKGQDTRAKRGYRPGDHVTGTVRTNYFFGKAVDHAHVTVKAVAMDVALTTTARAEGTTDGEGAYAFDLRLPDFLAGQASTHGAARVLIEATVKDNAAHTETHGETVTVSESPLLVTAVPESGALIPGFENQVYILTSYPDGTPARADLTVHAPNLSNRVVTTDESGIAVVPFLGTAFPSKLTVDARDREGNHASVPVELEARNGLDPVLLHMDRALYKAGEVIAMQIHSSQTKGSAYVDVVKDGQTIATHDIDIVNGAARLEFAATPDMAGTLELNAYVFGRDGRPSGDHRLVFVQPADELRIETTADATVYKPGGEARVAFRVTNRRGEGVQAAVGVEVVDQAVFALAEKQPGFAKVFFYLEQEIMKPRYEIHSIALPAVISSTQGDSRDRAAQALFSATEMNRGNNTTVNFGGDESTHRSSQYVERYRSRLVALSGKFIDQRGTECNTNTSAQVTDPWGNSLRIGSQPWNPQVNEVTSAGPDGRFGTSDDIVVYMSNPWCSPSPASFSDTIRVTHEYRRGAMGEISGTVADTSGAVITNASVRLRATSTGGTHSTRTGNNGSFEFADLRTGPFTIEVSAPGFKGARKTVLLKDNDRAVLSVTLQVGEVTQIVEVAAGTPMLMTATGVRMEMAPMAKKADFKDAAVVNGSLALNARSAKSEAAPATHIRSWFPESLYVNPEIITDKDGRASITIPIADNITTWRMSMLASTRQGALGSGTSGIKVFQDFFTEMDLPVTLTQGDEVSIPVAIYNYAGARGDVHLHLENADWFALQGDTADKTLAVDAGRVGGSQFNISAKRIGKYRLTLRAEMNGPVKRADIVVREIEVVPNGREQSIVFNGRLDSAARHEVDFPASALPDAETLFVRIYPGPMSQLVEGMDSILRMPGGCFEQTSSSTYPNVLALNYMKSTNKLTPEVSAKARGYIAAGYQRLVTFEVPGGGFSWFGSDPANKILTSYGLMEFSDMSKVYDVDPKVIQRTRQWLVAQQQPDGSWRPDNGGIAEGAINRFRSDALRVTAYVAWALETTGYQGQALERARDFIEQHTEKTDAYTLAVLANFAVDYGKDRAFTDRTIRLLLDTKVEQGDEVSWQSEQTGVYGSGVSAAVETTGLAAQALLKSGLEPAVAAKAMNFIVAKKDAAGTWGNTQATIIALRALLLASERGSATATGAVEVLLNGKPAAQLRLTPENNDLFHQFVFKGANLGQANRVELKFTGQGTPAYQVAGRYFTPWTDRPTNEALSIDVAYDRTHLEQDDIATATATVHNRLNTTANMVMLDLGIPPGFELMTEDLDSFRDNTSGKKSGRLEKYSLTPTQAILYFNSIAASETLKLSFRLRAKFPVRTRTFASRVYEYYDPAVSALARPIQLEVRKK